MRGLSKDTPLPPSTPQLRIHRYKQKHVADESASSKWAVTRAASESARAVTRTGRGRKGMSRSAHAAVRGSSRWKWDAASRHHPHTLFPPRLTHTHTLSSTASGLSLRDANCFCYLCQVPTLPRHILQTGPGPSAAFCVCSRNEKEKKRSALPSAASAPLFLLPAVAVGLPQWDKFTHSLRGWKKKCVRAWEMRTQNWHKELLIRNKIIPVWWLRKTLHYKKAERRCCKFKTGSFKLHL